MGEKSRLDEQIISSTLLSDIIFVSSTFLPTTHCFAMLRDFQKLKEGRFDLLVIGGGVLGAWTAYEAALRGLKTAIIEKADWAEGTSSASSKLIHGGLRYLQQFWLGLVYENLTERERLITIAPHRVFPLPFLIPLYQGAQRGRFSLKAGLTLYDLLAKVNSNTPFPGHKYLSKEKILSEAPCLRKENLTGGFLYTDARTDDARFTLEIVSGAVSSGATAVNYAKASELIISEGQVRGALVEDMESAERISVTASVTVNAAGPWAFSFPSLFKKSLPQHSLTKGVHLVMPPLPTKNALLLSAKTDHRIFFMLPWYGATLLGTTDTDYKGEAGSAVATSSDRDYLLKEGNSYLESPRWKASDVLGHFTGIRLLQASTEKSPSDTTREWLLFEPLGRFLMSIGGKFTSARLEAEKINDRVHELLSKSLPPKYPTRTRPFPWAPAEADWEQKLTNEGVKAGLDPETARLCSFRYGNLLPQLLETIKNSENLQTRIDARYPFCRGEIVYSLEHEMARNLKDIFFRRIPLKKIMRLKRSTVEECARIAAATSGWNQERMESEVSSILEEKLA